jgi:hypothetical protein
MIDEPAAQEPEPSSPPTEQVENLTLDAKSPSLVVEEARAESPQDISTAMEELPVDEEPPKLDPIEEKEVPAVLEEEGGLFRVVFGQTFIKRNQSLRSEKFFVFAKKLCSHIFGQIFFFVFTLSFGGDRVRVDYLRVVKRSKYTPAQRSKFSTAKV